jgi:anti-sigma factor ChrR (cupin superfamily)
MDVNADLDQRVVIDTAAMPWAPSPSAAVWRRRLDLRTEADGFERVTSVVRYDLGSKFPPHVHHGGEEIFVLDGVFEDEHGSYPAQSYLASPEGTRHAPFSGPGCTILVKLGFYRGPFRAQVVADAGALDWRPGLVPGLWVKPLYSQEDFVEHVALVRWEPGTVFRPHSHPGGEEIFVLDGVFEDEHGAYPAGTWIRNPSMSRHHPFSRQGCTIFVKTGGLVA